MNQPNSPLPAGNGGGHPTEQFPSPLRAWNGDMPLGQVFWGYGVFVSALLISGFVAALYQNNVWIQEALLIVFLAYTVWILTAIWRCSDGPSVWAMIARTLTVAWAANALLVAGFLQMNLMETALGL